MLQEKRERVSKPVVEDVGSLQALAQPAQADAQGDGVEEADERPGIVLSQAFGYVDAISLQPIGPSRVERLEAREIGQAATLMYALFHALLIHIQCGNFSMAKAQRDELMALATEKGTLFWEALGMLQQGFVLAVHGKTADAVRAITSGITEWR